MLERSPDYSKDLDLTYTEVTETKFSKLFGACVQNQQIELVTYMLRRNHHIFKTLIKDPSGEGYSNAFDYGRFLEKTYLADIWHFFD